MHKSIHFSSKIQGHELQSASPLQQSFQLLSFSPHSVTPTTQGKNCSDVSKSLGCASPALLLETHFSTAFPCNAIQGPGELVLSWTALRCSTKNLHFLGGEILKLSSSLAFPTPYLFLSKLPLCSPQIHHLSSLSSPDHEFCCADGVGK